MKNNKPLVVSYYVKGTESEQAKQDLENSCKQWGIAYEFTPISDRGSASKNACYKAEFILQKLQEHNRPLIWTNIHSVFMQYPEIFDACHADLALRVNNEVVETDFDKIFSGTFFVQPTLPAKKLLHFWQKECEQNLYKKATVSDQVCLRKVIFHYPTIVEIKQLPMSFIKISKSKGDVYSTHDNCVVFHQEDASKESQTFLKEVASSV